jgi:hypothetical protein
MSNFFPLNFQDLYEVNTNPGGTAVWERLASGLTGASQSNNDVTDQTTYLDGDGFGSTDVTGGQRVLSFAGHREIGDPAQDYIMGIASDFGLARKTQFRYRDSQGVGIDAEVTIANIEDAGGDANAKKDIAFEIHANGKPVKVVKSIAPDLTIVVAGGTASGTTSFTATPGGDNTLAYKLSAGALSDQYLNQYLDGEIAYTSGSDIIATAGQFLTSFELDANGRVVASNSYELMAGDITA